MTSPTNGAPPGGAVPQQRGTREAPIQTRAADVQPATFDAENRTVELVASTGATVRRYDYWTGEYYDEVLTVSSDAVDLARFESGSVPVLNAHWQYDLSQVIGTAVAGSARIEGGSLILTAKLSSREDVAPYAQDIADGIIRNVSVGYKILAYEVDETTKPKTRTITRWELLEVSFVPVGADGAAGTRSLSDPQAPQAAPIPAINVTVNVAEHASRAVAAPHQDEGENPVPTRTEDTAAQTVAAQTDETRSAAPTPPAPPAPAQVNRAAVNAEIRTIARTAGLDQAWIDAQIDASATADQARAAAWDAMATRQAPAVSTVHVVRDHTDPSEIRSRMADAIVARATFQAPPDHAREFMHFRVADMIVQLANTRGAKLDGRNHIEAVEHLFTRSGSHTTSDFPLLLQDAGNKILLPRYQAAAPSYRMFSSPRAFVDFKSHKFLRLGDFPALQEVKEAGETKYGTVSENREAITAKEYAAGLSIGRKALINDDLSAFSDFTGMIGVRVAQDENALVYTLLADNGPTMSDGKALYHADHGNKAGSGGDITVTTVGAAVQAMRNQTTLDGIKMSIGPKYLVVGTAKELVARQLLTAIQATQTDKVNPYAGAFELVVDANNSGNRWQMFADPAVLPTVVYGYVNGATGPQIRSEIDFDTRALKVAVGLDFACGVIDYRGGYLNAGA